jgi:hypothetical protein
MAAEAMCIVCGCVDSRACEGGCSWVTVNRYNSLGTCSSCKRAGGGGWLLRGWAFDHRSLQQRDTDRLVQLRELVPRGTAKIDLRANRRASKDYVVELPRELMRKLSLRDVALLCDSNLCFGGTASDEGGGRYRVTVYTD